MGRLQTLLIFFLFFLTISKRSNAQTGGFGGILDRFKNLGGLFGQGPQAAQSFCEDGTSTGTDDIDEEVSENCSKEPIDLLFVVDGSGSVGVNNFDKVKNFLNLIVDSTEVASDKTHIGLVQFSSRPKTMFSMNQHFSNAAVKAAISSIRHMGGGTMIADALTHVRSNELTSAKDRSDKKTIIIVITDGESQDDPKRISDQLRADGHTLMVLGIEGEPNIIAQIFGGSKGNLNEEQLLNIAGSKDRVFRVCDFKRLNSDVKNVIAAQICTEAQCKDAKADIIIVMDGSGSIGSSNFQKVKDFLKLIVDALEISSSKTRLALVQFNDQPTTEFSLDQYRSKSTLTAAIDRVRWSRGKTNIGDALEHTRRQELRKVRSDASAVVLVLTDGRSDDDPKDQAQKLRDDGVKTFALGITDEVDKSQLDEIAGDRKRRFMVRNFDKLNRRLKNAITSKICGEGGGGGQPGKVTDGNKVREYVGCFQDIGEIPYKSFDATMTIEKCIKSCPKDAQNRRLAGLKFRSYCYCGDMDKFENSRTKKSFKKTESDCNENCGGDSSEKCGGGTSYSVFLLTENEREGYVKETQHKGCWSDPFAKLQYSKYDPKLTVEKCAQICFRKDRAISATKLGVYCYCGNGNQLGDLRNADKQTDGKCNKKCTTDDKPCGDTVGLYYSVYELVEVRKGGSSGGSGSGGSSGEGGSGLDTEGCFYDRSRRLRLEKDNDRGMTARKCVNFCKRRSKSVAGIKKGGRQSFDCYCGDDLPDNKRRDSECRLRCSNGDYCGHSRYFSIYKIEGKESGGNSGRNSGEGTCEQEEMDVVFVVDGSSSIKQANFNKIKDFLKGMVRDMKISRSENQIAMVQFNNNPRVEFVFNEISSNREANRAIDRIRWMEGETRVGRALQKTLNDVLQSSNGYREDQGNLVVMVVTDGKSLDEPRRPARQLRNQGATIIAIAIGDEDDLDDRQLVSITGTEDRVFYFNDFSDLSDFQDDFNKEICAGPLERLGRRTGGLRGGKRNRRGGGNTRRGGGSGEGRGSGRRGGGRGGRSGEGRGSGRRGGGRGGRSGEGRGSGRRGGGRGGRSGGRACAMDVIFVVDEQLSRRELNKQAKISGELMQELSRHRPKYSVVRMDSNQDLELISFFQTYRQTRSSSTNSVERILKLTRNRRAKSERQMNQFLRQLARSRTHKAVVYLSSNGDGEEMLKGRVPNDVSIASLKDFQNADDVIPVIGCKN